jgi:sugar lactone lactonase
VRRLFRRHHHPEFDLLFARRGNLAYFTDTDEGIILFARRLRSRERPAAWASRASLSIVAQEGGIDGSVVDAEGRLWNARWGAGALDCYSPPDGTL